MPTPRSGWRTDGSRGIIALTIDTDGATGYTSAMLDTLEAHGVPASFGVTGKWVQANPDMLQRLVADGDAVMNHSWDHPDFRGLTKDQRLSELQRTEDMVEAVAGVSTKPYFRPPGGWVDASIRADVAEAGYVAVLWNIDSQGWRGKSAEAIEANVFQNARDGGIALFHVGVYSDYAALGPIIETLWNSGYRFVTISEAIGVPPTTPTPTPTPQPTHTPRLTPSPTASAIPVLN
jgi:peptidoglycan/xylan/chitin deacetylase (PgdA/CDA1 family)